MTYNELTDKQIIDDVIKIINETNDSSFKNYKKNGKYSEGAINHHFKNWTNLLNQIGIEPKKHHNISKEQLINDVKRIINETNNSTRENYLKYGKYSREIIKKHFSTWNNLLLYINQKINMHKPGQYNKDDIIQDYLNLCKIYNKDLSSIEYRKHGNFSQVIVDKEFGSFSNFKDLIGLRKDARFISDNEIKQNLIDLYNKNGFMSLDLIKKEAIVSPPTIYNRFDSFYDLMKELKIPYKIEDNISKLCKYVLNECKKILGEDYILEQTFDWLKVNDTKKHLYIDIYYPKNKLAIEVDGEQHFKITKYSPNKKALKRIQFRDNIKEELLKDHGIKLIRIKYNDKAKDIVKKLKDN